jgi:DNA-directed RNA polymerase III subunit RPC1
VDFTGRTVISPDPNVAIDEVVIPRLMAITLTIPEIVTPRNLNWLKTLIKNGAFVHPGANSVVHKKLN